MSADFRKELDIAIRASLKGGKDLEGVVKTLREIEKAIDDQAAAAKRGEQAFDGLKASEKALEGAAASLSKLGANLLKFQDAADNIASLNGVIDEQSQKWRTLTDSIYAAGKSTKEQRDELKSLEKGISSADAQLTKQQRTYDSIAIVLREAGLSLDDFAGSNKRVLDGFVESQSQLQRVRSEMDAYSKTVRDARDAANELAAAEKFAAQQASSQRKFREESLAQTFAPIFAAEDLAKRREQEAAALAERTKAFKQGIAEQKAAEADALAARIRAFKQGIAEQKAAEADANAARIKAFKQGIAEQKAAEADAQAKAAAKQAEIALAFRKAGDEALALARGYKTLGTTAKTLTSSSGGLKAVIQGITDPARQARETLQGIEAQIKDVSTAISSTKGPIDDYRDKVSQLSAAQRAIAQQADLVDSWVRQQQVLKAAGAEYQKAKAEVTQLAAQMRNASTANDQVAASLVRAQSALVAAQKNLTQQVTATRSLRDSMRQAGLATTDLATTQSRLTAAAQSGTNALQRLESAHRKYGDAAGRSARIGNVFTDGGRTTLSLLQRIRGEVLALASAYVGLYGAINGAQKSVEAYNNRAAVRNQLAISVGNDEKAIRQEYDYIRKLADKLGVSFESAAKGYAKFAASTRLAGKSATETKFIFESFAEVARVANLTADEFDGVLKALSQMVDKGKIQAEELRGQLGDRLFGAFQIAAQALKDQFPNLDKAMKDGLITSEQLLAIAAKYRETVGPRLADATSNLASNQARLNNALYDFKLLIADSGFAVEYEKAVTRLTTFFKSTDGTKMAKSLSDAFSAVARTLVWLVENFEAVKRVMIDLGAIYVQWKFLQLGASLYDLATNKIPSAIGKLKELGGSARFVAGGLGVLGAGIAALAIADMTGLVNLSRGLREAVATMEEAERRGWLPFFAKLAGIGGFVAGSVGKSNFDKDNLELERLAKQEQLLKDIDYQQKMIAKWSKSDADDATKQNAISGYEKTLRKLRAEYYALAEARGKAMGIKLTSKTDLKDQSQKSWEAYMENFVMTVKRKHKTLASALREFESEAARVFKNTKLDAWAPGGGYYDDIKKRIKASFASTTGMSKEELDKQKTLLADLEREILAAERRIEKNETDSLTSRLNAIDMAYQELFAKIKDSGLKVAPALTSRLTEAVMQLKMQETQKFNDETVKSQTDLQKKLEGIDAQIGKKSKTDMDARLAAIQSSYEETYRQIDALAVRDPQVAQFMREYLDDQVKALQNLEKAKVYEDQVNAILAHRKALLDTIAAKQAAGLPEVEANEQRKAALDVTQVQLEKIVEQGLAYVEAMLLSAEATGENVIALEALRAKLLEAKNEASLVKTGMYDIGGVLKDSMAQFFNQLTSGTVSFKDALRGMVLSFAQALGRMGAEALAADLANKIFPKTAAQSSANDVFGIFKGLFDGIKKLLGGLGDLLGGLFKGIGSLFGGGGFFAGLFHDGGVVGAPGGQSRPAYAAWFANAPRYHGGGIPGLAPNEYPAILKKNEEVLTDSDPRNVLNGGLSGGSARPADIKIINTIDSSAMVNEALSSGSTQKAILNFIGANRTEVKAMLGAA